MKKFLIVFICMFGVSVKANIISDSLTQYRGHQAYSLGNFKKAEQEYLKLLAHDPYNAQANYNMGVCLYQQKKHEEAEHYFARSVHHAGEKSKLQEQALFNQADALVKQNKLQPALELYEKVLKINPENKDAQNNLAVVKNMIEQQKKQQQGDDNQQQQDKQQKKNDEKSSKSKNQKSKDQGQSSENQSDQSQDDQQQSDSDKSEHDKKSSIKDSEESKQEQQSKNKQQENAQNDNKGKQGRNQEQQKQQEQQQEKTKNSADGLEKSSEKKDKKNGVQGKNEQEKNDEHDKESSEKLDKEHKKTLGHDGKEEEKEAVFLKDELADDLLSKAGDDKRLDKRSMQIMQIMEDDEKNIQKQLLKMNVTKQGAKNHGQKNW